MIKLLAIDLDDTLLTHNLEIPDKNRIAVEEAEKLGVEVVLASGRTIFSMKPYAEKLCMNGRPGFMVTSNGSTVYDTLTSKVLYQKTLDYVAANDVYKIVTSFGLTMQYYGHGIIYSSGMSEYTDRDCMLTGQSLEVVDDFDQQLRGRSKLVIPGDPQLLLSLQKQLKESVGDLCNIFISKPYFLEVLPKDADKGTALAYIAEYHGIKDTETMAIGDSMNDYGMITWAGVGVAMANAMEAIKQIADCIVPLTNDESGVAWAIEKFILEPRRRKS